MFAESNKGIGKLYQNMRQLFYRIIEVTRVTKTTDNAVMRIAFPEMFPDVTFSVSPIGA